MYTNKNLSLWRLTNITWNPIVTSYKLLVLQPSRQRLKLFPFISFLNSLKLQTINFYHSTHILYSEGSNSNSEENRNSNNKLNEPKFAEPEMSNNSLPDYTPHKNSLEAERQSQLPKVKYPVSPYDTEETWQVPSSDEFEYFPFFNSKDSKYLPFNAPISLFDGVDILARYLETMHGVEPDLISKHKFSEILTNIEDKPEITKLELCSHITKLFREDYKQNLNTGGIDNGLGALSLPSYKLPISNPFGTLGDLSVNKISISLKYKLQNLSAFEAGARGSGIFFSESAKITVHGLPLAIQSVSSDLVLNNYLKYVHTRGLRTGLSPEQQIRELITINRMLTGFSLVGAPIMFFLLIHTAPSFKDVFTVSFGGTCEIPTNANSINNNEISNNGLYFFLVTVFNKIPGSIKYFLNLFFCIIFIFKLMGYSFLTLSDPLITIKIFSYISSSLIISYNLFYLFCIYKFSYLSKDSSQSSFACGPFCSQFYKTCPQLEVSKRSKGRKGRKGITTSTVSKGSQNKHKQIVEPATKKIVLPNIFPKFFINYFHQFEIVCSSNAGIESFKQLCYIEITLYLILLIFTALVY